MKKKKPNPIELQSPPRAVSKGLAQIGEYVVWVLSEGLARFVAELGRQWISNCVLKYFFLFVRRINLALQICIYIVLVWGCQF